MPVGQALLAGTEGAAFGFFPILWIVINAIWVYNMTVVTGHFDVLRRSFARVSDDQRIQAVIIAFCFGALLEALAGFGTPVAITSVMLIALGFGRSRPRPSRWWPTPRRSRSGRWPCRSRRWPRSPDIPEHTLAQMVGRQTPLLGVFVPMALVFIIDRGAGVRGDLPATLVCGIVFALAQFITSNYISTQLTDIVASLWAPPRSCCCCACGSPAEPLRRGRTDRAEAAGQPARRRDGRPPAGRGRDARRRRRGSAPATAAGPPGRHGHRDGRRARRPGRRRARQPRRRGQGVRAVPHHHRRLHHRPAAGDQGRLVEEPDQGSAVAGPATLQTAGRQAARRIPTFKFNWLAAAGTLMLIAGLHHHPGLRHLAGARRCEAYVDDLPPAARRRSSRSWPSWPWRTS